MLVTAGPSIEDIDPVRYITNRSTGKMGYAIANAAINRGCEVCLLSGPTNLEAPKNVNVEYFRSTNDLLEQMKNKHSYFDIIIQAAAPADYTTQSYSKTKIKKSEDTLLLEMKKTPDVAQYIAKNKLPNQIFVGFAAETDNVLENAKKKLIKKNLDFIVLNNVSLEGAGFGVDSNIVSIIDKNKIINYDIMSKNEVADIILDKIEELLEAK